MNIGEYFKSIRLAKRAKKLRYDCESQGSLANVVKTVHECPKFSLVQKRDEIVSFTEIVSKLQPKVICDIGSSGGGTIRLFSHYADLNARIISIDIANTEIRQKSYPNLMQESQTLTMINASSYAPQTVDKVREWLGYDQIDLIFIDGDHEYEGVKKDFENYSPLVRKGGVIGFHDIVEDYKTRYGKETSSWVGEVPRYWKEIKNKFSKTEQLIEDPDQDGFGIGVIHW